MLCAPSRHAHNIAARHEDGAELRAGTDRERTRNLPEAAHF
jgi:hypothetical protein